MWGDAAVRAITREISVCQRQQTEAEGLISQSRHVGTERTSHSCYMSGWWWCWWWWRGGARQ